MALQTLKKRGKTRKARKPRRERSGVAVAWLSYAGVLALPLGIAAFIGGRTAYILLWVCVAAPVLSLGHLLLCSFSLRVLHRMEHLRLYRLEQSRYALRLINRAIWPIPRVRFRFDDPGQGETVMRECHLLPRQVLRLFFTLRFPHRGRYAVQITKLQLYDSFGLFRVTLRFQPTLPVTVYPRVPELTGYPMESRGNESGTVRSFQESDELSGESRKFMPGDSLSRIHRNLTARQNEIMTRLREPEADASCACYLDLRPIEGDGAAAREDAVIEACLAALRYWVLELRLPVSFVCCLPTGLHSMTLRTTADYDAALTLCAETVFQAALPPEMLLRHAGAMPYAALFTAAPPQEALLRSMGALPRADIFCFGSEDGQQPTEDLQALCVHTMTTADGFAEWAAGAPAEDRL